MKTITKTKTHTNSYTKNRADVLDDHFELFLRCSNMSDSEVNKLLKAADEHEIKAFGIYIEENDYRIAEVEFEVDWDKHSDLVKLKGEVFDTDFAGWKDGIAPEAYIPAQHLVNTANNLKLPVRSWIRISNHIRNNPTKYKQVCEKLGYSGPVPNWKAPPEEKSRQINGLEEAKVTSRVVKINRSKR